MNLTCLPKCDKPVSVWYTLGPLWHDELGRQNYKDEKHDSWLHGLRLEMSVWYFRPMEITLNHWELENIQGWKAGYKKGPNYRLNFMSYKHVLIKICCTCIWNNYKLYILILCSYLKVIYDTTTHQFKMNFELTLGYSNCAEYYLDLDKWKITCIQPLKYHTE